MRRIPASSSVLVLLALGVCLLPACWHPLPKRRPGFLTPWDVLCPRPVMTTARGHFYANGGNLAFFDLEGTYAGLNSGEHELDSVVIFGASGNKTVAQLTDEDHYALTYLTTIYPMTGGWPFDGTWKVHGLAAVGVGNAWDGGTDYTIVVRHRYKKERLTKPVWCTRSRALHFGEIDPAGSTRVPAVDDAVPFAGTGSHTASASFTGSFFGLSGYALYDGDVNYQVDTPGVTVQAIEVYSSLARNSLYDESSRFHTQDTGLAIPPAAWSFSNLNDPHYTDEDFDTWFVGFRVIYSDGTHKLPFKKFTGLTEQQGQSVPGE